MSESAGPASFGRVDADGTVFVLTADGERSVGQVPDAEPNEALEFFVKRFVSLEVEVNVLATRVNSGSLSPEEARRSIEAMREHVRSANAVGDFAALLAQLDSLSPLVEKAAEQRRAARHQRNEETRAAKEAMLAEAEALAAGDDWRFGVNRFRTLLEEWKALPRIDRATDDQLWHRFSTARTTYTRRRKAQFAELTERRERARQLKEEIIAEAEPLADSTDWGATSAEFRSLVARWKAAGSAHRPVDNELWARFRAIQDKFFTARNETLSRMDTQLSENLAAKEALLDEAEKALLPVTDVTAAREAYRDFLNRFNALGDIPHASARQVSSRLRAIETAIRQAEDDEWKRTDPQARQRAEETVAMFAEHIEKLKAKLSAAEARSDTRAAKDARDSIATYESWLAQAQANLDEFSR